MEAQEQSRFVDDVVNAAERIDLEDSLASSMRAQDFSFGEGNSAPAVDPEIQDAKRQAAQLVHEPTVRERLCPALSSVSDDVGSIAKVVGPALLPLALTGAGAVVPLSSLVFGAIAVVIARAGVAAICPDSKKSAKKGDD